MQNKNTFRFSPNPNRADEINWYPWNQETFKLAEEEKKPVLLAISGVWCHWCHVMDETTYSNPKVINLINHEFIPIRVDTDERPDINNRYNLGGWPTTAILTPRGKLVSGGTYIPPDRMIAFLEHIVEHFRENPEILESIDEEETELKTAPSKREEQLDLAVVKSMEDSVKEEYDSHYGGFGSSQKFPLVETLRFALETALEDDDDTMREILEKTLKNMAEGGIYDPVEGGFFRYSTRRDWTEPHYEKMLEDNSRLITLLLHTYQYTRDEFYQKKASEVLEYLKQNLFIDKLYAFGGSQDADEKYYQAPLEERRTMKKPYVDDNIYTDKNGLMAEALIISWQVLRQEKWLDLAEKTLEDIWERNYREEKGLAHLFRNGKAELWGYLDDLWAMGKSLNRLYQLTGNHKWLKRSKTLADYCLNKLQTPHGPFSDIPQDGENTPETGFNYFSLESNSMAARWLIETYHLTGNEDYLKAARGALVYWQKSFANYGILAAPYASAVKDLLRDWLDITLIGKPEQTGHFRKYILEYYWPRLTLQPLNPEDEKVLPVLEKRGLIEVDTPQALICIGDRCLKPIFEPEELKRFLEENISPLTVGV